MAHLTDTKLEEIKKVFTDKNCELLIFTKKSEKLTYKCACGITKQKLYKDFTRNKKCRTCTSKKIYEKPDEILIQSSIESWKPVNGGFVSNLGNAKSSLGKILTLCPTKFRYHIGGKHQYASRLIAEAFQIENYEKLNDTNYVVMHMDEKQSNNNLDNLKIVNKSVIGSINGKKSRKGGEFSEKLCWSQDYFKDIQYKTIEELPKHILYFNGEIWNGTRFLTFSKSSENYYSFLSYKVHRLICYAFHPVEGKNKLSDYDDLQVNHKDGNTLNNTADNLEWVCASLNIKHSYDTKLNRKTRNVLQYTHEGEFIKEYISIAEASRGSKEPEHRIRTLCQGKTNSKALFEWKFKNDEESKEYSKKYSSK
jgi:hypothetical protein